MDAGSAALAPSGSAAPTRTLIVEEAPAGNIAATRTSLLQAEPDARICLPFLRATRRPWPFMPTIAPPTVAR